MNHYFEIVLGTKSLGSCASLNVAEQQSKTFVEEMLRRGHEHGCIFLGRHYLAIVKTPLNGIRKSNQDLSYMVSKLIYDDQGVKYIERFDNQGRQVDLVAFLK